MSEVVVSADNLRKAFGATKALDGLSLRIARGEKYGLLGPNGSGKTTLIRAILGLVTPDSGEVKVLGHGVPSPVVAARVGYMTQAAALYEDLSPRENLRFFAMLFGTPAGEIPTRIDEALELVGLADRADSPVRTLSGGLRQRASLAAALVHRPELMLLDEPTVGMDPEVRRALWRHFDRLNTEGRTFVISTHVMDEAERCGRIGLLRAGRFLAEGSPRELKEQAGAASLEEAYLWFAERAEAAALGDPAGAAGKERR
jgi:ABC-2 type transport system ATP-binding protein